jgi:hypothetical protein
MDISVRLAVLALYLIIAFGIFLFFAGGGDGSMTPLSMQKGKRNEGQPGGKRIRRNLSVIE